MVTIFENIYSDKPNYKHVAYALDRIKNGKSKFRIEQIRSTLDKDKADLLKRQLPSVCFSGKFGPERTDESLIQHSGFLVLDFDNMGDELRERQTDLISLDYVFACWVSPRGNGLKALVKIADGKKHREHFAALKEIFTEVDKSGVNPSRVCYESYDPEIFINEKAVSFKKIKVVEQIEVRESLQGEQEVFKRLLTWLSNRHDAFVTGERNLFIFKLAAACCRFGINHDSAVNLILQEYPSSNDFTQKECANAIKSAYKSNRAKQGTATFDRDILVEKTTRKEIVIDAAIYDESVRPKDVVYGEDVKLNAVDLWKYGYQNVKGVGIRALDELWKPKGGEVTLLTGHGNYGKSAFKKWYQVLRAILYDEKFASFPPEDYPVHHFYHDLVEIFLGCDCTLGNQFRPTLEIYSEVYDWISKHFFYIYPTTLAPTPEYTLERFLELIIKEKINGWDIDPFNQMTHDYAMSGGRSDKYLETILGGAGRFTQQNNVYGMYLAHPIKMSLGKDGNYPCPNVYDVADGAMWNNKMDNILVYHRPFMQVNPDDPTCEFHSKKIRNQKIVGKKGFTLFEYKRRWRRYFFDGVDYLDKALKDQGIEFKNLNREVRA